MDYIAITTDDYLEHHGILGQKWGIRRYQNADGSLTEAGRKHANVQKYKMNRTDYENYLNEQLKGKNKTEQTKIVRQESRNLDEGKTTHQRTVFKLAAGIPAAIAASIATGGAFVAGIPAAAIFAAPYSALAAGTFGAALGSMGDMFINNEKDTAKDNLMNMKYDELNIDENTKRRLNL